MKKQIILAFTAALGITMSASVPVQAASANRVNISVFEKDCTTNQWNSMEADSIKAVLEKICERFPAAIQPGECTPEVPKDDSTSGNELPKEDVTEDSYAKQVLTLVNAQRKKAGLNELIWDDTVAAAAATRSKEIETSFSHTRPDGRNFGTAITDLGITYRGTGENIAWGQKTPEAVMHAWMNSEGHRANILNPNFKKLGVGYRTNGQGTAYWTQLFTY